MKLKLLTFAILCSFVAVKSFGQVEAGVENVHSIKVPLPFGVGYGYERALSRQITLNTELMLAGGYGGRYGAILVPTLRIEPRFYYNYLNRIARGKKVLNNSASFLSLSIENSFNTYLTYDDVKKGTNLISIIPKWGLRKTIGQNFFFEGAIGLGTSYSKLNKFKVVPSLDLRLGYTF